MKYLQISGDTERRTFEKGQNYTTTCYFEICVDALDHIVLPTIPFTPEFRQITLPQLL